MNFWDWFLGKKHPLEQPAEPVAVNMCSLREFCDREDPVYKKGRNGKYQCPCCLHFTLDKCAKYEICGVCFWEDDGTTNEHCFSPNKVTLAQGRENYKNFGSCEEEMKKHCREPFVEEMN